MFEKENPYFNEPILICENIKIFSKDDEYIKNYEQISIDHFASVKDGVLNTFIEEKVWQEMEESTYQIILKYIQKDFNVLDVGVGTGRLLDKLSGVNKFGVDITMQNLRLSSSKNIEVCLSKAEDLPYKDNFFDIIVSTDVLEHAVDLNKVLSQVYRVLKVGGKFIIRVPYKEKLQVYLDENYPYYFSHLRSFDEYSLRLIIEKIFRFKYITHNFTLYFMNPDKLKCNIPILSKVLWKTLRFTEIFLPSVFLKLKRALLEPTEINMVFEKIS